ncbi:MAG: enoyl-CoA hydratase/isomerase family protein [Candidatus Hydrogenedentes bacterium]|nr:enoyl-CoA hydratase/isomerase family protein [Candidatus Hydrogenedentota bacterium]
MADTTAIEDHILTSIHGHILKIEMNRPEKKNAITRAMYTQMADALGSAVTDGQIRVVYITGVSGIFTSGNDVLDFMNAPNTDADGPVGRFLKAIVTFPKPIVAAVDGHAIGIGTTMLLHCDLVYAGANARFQMPFVDLGLCPEAASSLLLPGLLGHARAAEYLLLCEPFNAVQAVAIGLANVEHSSETLQEAAWAKAEKLAEKAPASIRITKQLMREGQHDVLEARLKREGEEFAARLVSPEAAEAFQAFAMRRAPDFSSFE